MNEPAIFKLDEQFVSDIRNIIITARTTAMRSVDFERVKMYWKLGERIMLEEQGGKERAEYGTKLLQHLADNMEAEFGSGFSYRQLAFCRQFYNTYRNMNALRSQLDMFCKIVGEKLISYFQLRLQYRRNWKSLFYFATRLHLTSRHDNCQTAIVVFGT